MDLDIDFQLERLERYKARVMTAESKPLTGMPSGGGIPGDRLAEYVARKEELENRISGVVKAQQAEKNAVENGLRQVGSASERAVIRMRYFDRCSWDEVVDMMFGGNGDCCERRDSYLRRVLKIHGSALQNLAAVLGTGEENEEQLTPGDGI